MLSLMLNHTDDINHTPYLFIANYLYKCVENDKNKKKEIKQYLKPSISNFINDQVTRFNYEKSHYEYRINEEINIIPSYDCISADFLIRPSIFIN